MAKARSTRRTSKKKQVAEENVKATEVNEVKPEEIQNTNEPEVKPEEVKEENKPEETPQPEEEKNKPKEVKADDIEEVEKKKETEEKIKEEKTKTEEKEPKTFLDELIEKGKPGAEVATALKSIINQIRTGEKEKVVNAMYNLHVTIQETLKIKNYGLFKQKFDVINKAFREFGKNELNVLNFTKYKADWKFGYGARERFFEIIALISKLADPKTRKAATREINIPLILSKLDNVARINIKKYYNV